MQESQSNFREQKCVKSVNLKIWLWQIIMNFLADIDARNKYTNAPF